MNKIPNNDEKVAKLINAYGLEGVRAVGDDGSVCIQVTGSKEYTEEVARRIYEDKSLPNRVGDGVQEGDYFINNYEENIHQELSDFNLF